VKFAIDAWVASAGLQSGVLFRAVGKTGKVWGSGFTAKVIWSIVRQAASDCGFGAIAPHDLRRTCGRLCHQAGGELEQIQFLLRHVSVQTTERYLGCKQRLRDAGNGRIGLEPASP
jgi:site-specific recombinase XerD